MREGDASSKGLSPLVIMGAIGAMMVVIGTGVYLVQSISNSAPVNVVVLKAEADSFKEKPEQAPEEEGAGSQSSVMTMLDELQQSKDDVEILSLKPEAPEMPEIEVETPVADDAKAIEAEADETDKVEASDSEQTQTAALDTQEATEDTDDTDDTAKPKKRPLKPLVSKNSSVKGPSLMVQLAAFRDQKKAEEVAALLTEKHKERLQGLGLGIMQADTGSSGIFWRVTTEPLPTEDARALCDALKRAGQDCIFRKVSQP